MATHPNPDPQGAVTVIFQRTYPDQSAVTIALASDPSHGNFQTWQYTDPGGFVRFTGDDAGQRERLALRYLTQALNQADLRDLELRGAVSPSTERNLPETYDVQLGTLSIATVRIPGFNSTRHLVTRSIPVFDYNGQQDGTIEIMLDRRTADFLDAAYSGHLARTHLTEYQVKQYLRALTSDPLTLRALLLRDTLSLGLARLRHGTTGVVGLPPATPTAV